MESELGCAGDCWPEAGRKEILSPFAFAVAVALCIEIAAVYPDCQSAEDVSPGGNYYEEGFEGETLVVGSREEEIGFAGKDGLGY